MLKPDPAELMRLYPPPYEERAGRKMRLIPASAILPDVEAFLKRTGMTKTAFGLAAVGGIGVVEHLRRGRGISDYRYSMIRHYLDTHEA